MRTSRLWVILAIVAVVTLYAVVLHRTYTWSGTTHPDFFVEWKASRVALSGGNPYSEETTRAIQMGSKGYEVPEEQDQLAFVYPYYAVLVDSPLALLPYEWATAIRQSIAQLALIAGALLFVRALHWQASVGSLLLVLLIVNLAYPTFGGIMLGQMAVIVVALLLFAFWALRQGHDWLAGACLALATLKPSLILLAVPAFLLWSLSGRRWRVLLSFAIVLGILVTVSLIAYPAWLREFVQGLLRYPSYKRTETGPSFLLSDCCGPLWPWVLEIAAILFLLAGWWAAWRLENGPWLEGAFALTLAMTAFITPQASPIDRILLLPAVILLMRAASSWVARIAIAAVALVGPWLAYVYGYPERYDLYMAWPSLIVLLALAVWYVSGVARHGKLRTKPKTS